MNSDMHSALKYKQYTQYMFSLYYWIYEISIQYRAFHPTKQFLYEVINQMSCNKKQFIIMKHICHNTGGNFDANLSVLSLSWRPDAGQAII